MIDEFNRVGWARLKEEFKSNYGDYPSVISLLFIIGMEHAPVLGDDLSKEQKQEVIHVGLCSLLEKEGLYSFSHHDDDGWPHYTSTDKSQTINVEKQENYIKQLLINYFNDE